LIVTRQQSSISRSLPTGERSTAVAALVLSSPKQTGILEVNNTGTISPEGFTEVMTMPINRPAAVAGLFYPDHPALLSQQVSDLLRQVPDTAGARAPRALVVPHAGYRFSGAIAARAYARLRPWREHYQRVLLLGPCHGVPFEGLALSSAEHFSTPLGDVPLDRAACEQLRELPGVRVFAAAHAGEHSLEVQLPFLQSLLGDFTLVPLAVGAASPAQVAAVIDHFWEDSRTLMVISTDLSHFLDQTSAEALDVRTRGAVERLAIDDIGYEQACGRNPLRGLLAVLKEHGTGIETLAMGTSAQASGDYSRVVGYGAWVVQ
jgi:AmmeMemoRadiSam system protein B